MARDRYTLTSTRNKDGKLKHHYSGKLNRNANEDHPMMWEFIERDQAAIRIRRMHEDAMRTKGIEKMTTSVVGEKIGLSAFQRILNYLGGSLIPDY